MNRKTFVTLGMALASNARTSAGAKGTADATHSLAHVETKSGGRLGVYARDLGSGRANAHRARERFPCAARSSFSPSLPCYGA